MGVILAGGRLRYWSYHYQGVVSGWGMPVWAAVKPDVAEASGLPDPSARFSLRCFKSERGVWGDGFNIDLPLWPFFGVCLLVTVSAIRAARRVLPGHCYRCHYDLRGLPVCACPECGLMQ